MTSCWYLTDHFFVGLPSGEIVDIFVNRSDIPLMNMAIAQRLDTSGSLSVYRDQPEAPAAKEVGSCLPIENEARSTVIEVEITRIDDPSAKAQVLDPADFFAKKTFDKEACSQLIKKIPGPTTINPG